MIIDRRTFLAGLGGGIVAAQLGCLSSARANSGSRRLRSVGVQLYSLRDDARKNLEQTLADIAAIGYRDVELLGSMNNFGMPATQLRAVLDRNGLRASSTHIGGSAFDDLGRLLDDAQALGHRYLTLASLPIQGQRTLDDYRRWADRLNEVGRKTKERGIWIAFHNHANDHTRIDGVVPYDVLVDRTDPSLVRHQLDTGNAAMAGIDPLDYMKKYGSRYWLFHIKDVPSLNARNDAELGKGIVDFPKLLASIEGIDDKFLYVEQESYPGAPIDSLRRDYAYISTLDF